MHLTRRNHEQRQHDRLSGPQRHLVFGDDVRMIDRTRGRHARLRAIAAELSALSPALERQVLDDLVHDVNVLVVVVHEIADEPVVGARELADAAP